MDPHRRRALCQLAAFAALPWTALAQPHRETTRLIAALSPPYVYRSPEGSDGPALNAARDLAKLASFADPIELLPWEQALAQADLSPFTLVFPLERTLELESHFLWLAPLMADEWVIVSFRPIERDSDPLVGTLHHSGGMELAGHLGYAAPVPFAHPEEGLHHLLSGRLDGWLAPRRQSEYQLQLAGIRGLHWSSGLAPFTLYLAAHRLLPDAQLRRWRHATRAGQRGGRFGYDEELA
ncbi:hypothetical protein [Chitinimonas lacunae]|uniref:ABC transporter substrate-binding protein n=1 Tax=Chitinimonas lacunae TaxID=1963018 RepID=A0ABV8MVT6_9NEIS